MLVSSLGISDLIISLLVFKSGISNVGSLYSGNLSTIGGNTNFPLSSTGVLVDSGLVYSGFSFTGGSIEFTPPLYSGFSFIGASAGFVPPLYSGSSLITGGNTNSPLSSTGVLVDNGPVY